MSVKKQLNLSTTLLFELKLKSLESITMPGLSRYVKAFMGVLTAFFLFMTGCLQLLSAIQQKLF